MAYPLKWIQQTFPTRERTVELLRPELEGSVLTPRDYELATRFLPGPSSHWPTVYALAMSTAVYGYATRVARPRWTLLRLGLVGVGASILGSIYGKFKILSAHYKFANTLEDPQAFMAALNHVDTKLGGPGNIASDFSTLSYKLETKRNHDRTRDVEVVRDEGWAEDHTAEADTSKPKSKWEEIKAANSQSARHSSWDIIRQRHERSRLPESSTLSGGTSEANERAVAQAEFDALLEAERRRGQSQSSREFQV